MSNARFVLRTPAHALSLSKTLKKILKDRDIAWSLARCQTAVARMLGYADLKEIQAVAGQGDPSPFDHEAGVVAALSRRARQVAVLVKEGLTERTAEVVVGVLAPTAIRDSSRLARTDVGWFLASAHLRRLLGIDAGLDVAGLLDAPSLRRLALRTHEILASDPFAGPRYAAMHLPGREAGWFSGTVGDMALDAAHPLLAPMAFAGLLRSFENDGKLAGYSQGKMTYLVSGAPVPINVPCMDLKAAFSTGDVDAFDRNLAILLADTDNDLQIPGAALSYGLYCLADTALAERALGAKPGDPARDFGTNQWIETVHPYPMRHFETGFVSPDDWERIHLPEMPVIMEDDGPVWKRSSGRPADVSIIVHHSLEAGRLTPIDPRIARSETEAVLAFLESAPEGMTAEMAKLARWDEPGRSLAYAAFRTGWRKKAGKHEFMVELGPCGSGSPSRMQELLAAIGVEIGGLATSSSWTRVEPHQRATILLGPKVGRHPHEAWLQDIQGRIAEGIGNQDTWAWPCLIQDVKRDGGFIARFPVLSVRPSKSNKPLLGRLVQNMFFLASEMQCEVSVRSVDGHLSLWIGEAEAWEVEQEYDENETLVRKIERTCASAALARALDDLAGKCDFPYPAGISVGPNGSATLLSEDAFDDVEAWLALDGVRMLDLSNEGDDPDASQKSFALDQADRIARLAELVEG